MLASGGQSPVPFPQGGRELKRARSWLLSPCSLPCFLWRCYTPGHCGMVCGNTVHFCLLRGDCSWSLCPVQPVSCIVRTCVACTLTSLSEPSCVPLRLFWSLLFLSHVLCHTAFPHPTPARSTEEAAGTALSITSLALAAVCRFPGRYSRRTGSSEGSVWV